nr:hypothetical protein [Tanacetum cinerariifolium]
HEARERAYHQPDAEDEQVIAGVRLVQFLVERLLGLPAANHGSGGRHHQHGEGHQHQPVFGKRDATHRKQLGWNGRQQQPAHHKHGQQRRQQKHHGRAQRYQPLAEIGGG